MKLTHQKKTGGTMTLLASVSLLVACGGGGQGGRDPAPLSVQPALQIENISVMEGDSGNTQAVFRVTLSASSSATVMVDYRTADGTAVDSEDYTGRSGRLSFAPGETDQTVTVDVVGDSAVESDETFRLILFNAQHADLSGGIEGVATIVDDDAASTALLSNPGPQSFDEERHYTLDITARPGARLFVSGMPPGMEWDEAGRRFSFRPDFIQGGRAWQITMEAVDGAETDVQTFTVSVNNTIQPPWPTLVATQQLTGVTKYTVRQMTDDFLDSPGYAGREFTANLAIPTAASATNPLPVRIGLHGFGGSPGTVGRAGYFGIAPHDPNNTWWSGYSDQVPLPSGQTIAVGTVPNYTQRRVMHLLSYLLSGCPGLISSGVDGCPGADPQRVSVSGQSMGGTGSLFLAIHYGRHFAAVSSRIGGTTPHFLSPGSQDGLSRFFWGQKNLGLPDDRGINVWERYDAGRAALSERDFRNLHFSTISGKNDPVIPFDAMVGVSPVTGRSFLDVLQEEGIGHFSVWDQRAHGVNDPPLSAVWWAPLDESESAYLRRDLAFPAFSNSSADDDAGEPNGMGGYSGALRGAINRYLRWDSANIIDERDRLSIPVRADIDTTVTPPAAGYPPPGNGYLGALPITADVTIRRIQNFQLLPGETVRWRYDGASGTVSANDDGSVTIRKLAITPGFISLFLERVP